MPLRRQFPRLLPRLVPAAALLCLVATGAPGRPAAQLEVTIEPAPSQQVVPVQPSPTQPHSTQPYSAQPYSAQSSPAPSSQAPSSQARTLRSSPELAALQVRWVVYHRLMAEILRSSIREQVAQGGSAVVDVNPYPSVTASKALSACINWRQSTLERITWGGFAYRYGGAVAPDELEDLTRRALEDCTGAYLGRDCVCQAVDVNGENVLEVPADFLARHGRF